MRLADKFLPHDKARFEKERLALDKELGVQPEWLLSKPIIQQLAVAPLQLLLFFSVKRLGDGRFMPDYNLEGWGWFTNLGAADPYWALPI